MCPSLSGFLSLSRLPVHNSHLTLILPAGRLVNPLSVWLHHLLFISPPPRQLSECTSGIPFLKRLTLLHKHSSNSTALSAVSFWNSLLFEYRSFEENALCISFTQSLKNVLRFSWIYTHSYTHTHTHTHTLLPTHIHQRHIRLMQKCTWVAAHAYTHAHIPTFTHVHSHLEHWFSKSEFLKEIQKDLLEN